MQCVIVWSHLFLLVRRSWQLNLLAQLGRDLLAQLVRGWKLLDSARLLQQLKHQHRLHLQRQQLQLWPVPAFVLPHVFPQSHLLRERIFREGTGFKDC